MVWSRRHADRRTAPAFYLLAVGYLWFLGSLTSAASSWLFTAGWVLSDLIFIPFTALVLAYPTGRLETRLERAIPLATALILVPASILALLFDPTPAPDTCPDCAGSAIVIADIPEIGSVADVVSSLGGLALIATVVWILVRRWRRASPALRRLLWPVLGTGAATLIAVAALVVSDLFSPTVADALQLVFLLCFASVPIAFLFGVLRTRLARTSVTDVVLALESGIRSETRWRLRSTTPRSPSSTASRRQANGWTLRGAASPSPSRPKVVRSRRSIGSDCRLRRSSTTPR